MRIVDVQPPLGTRVGPDTEIRVEARYRLPEGAARHHASLMFLSERGGLVSARGARGIELRTDTGTIQLSARAGDVRPALRQPLTLVVTIIGDPAAGTHADTIIGRDRIAAELERIGESSEDAPSERAGLIRLRAIAPAVARSRALFYNGAGPAAGLRGPRMPFEEVLVEYRSYGSEKAFALAVDADGRRSWGYAYGYDDVDTAIARALEECRQRVRDRELSAPCRVHAVGNTILPR